MERRFVLSAPEGERMKRLLAIFLIFWVLLSLNACFKVHIDMPKTDGEWSRAATEAVPVTDYVVPTVPAEGPGVPDQPTAAIPEETAAQEQTLPQETAAPTAAPAAKTPDKMTNEELLSFFNQSLNRIKTERVGFKKSKLTSILDLQLSNSMANTLVGFVKGALLSETADETSVAKGEDGTGVFSPSGKPYVSALTPDDLTSIKCTANGGQYVIVIAVKGETNPEADGSLMSRGFDFMTVDDVVNLYAPKVGATVSRENIEVVFSDCTATLTVDASGRVSAYKTYVKGVMNMKNATIKKVVEINTDLAITLASTTDYSGFAY